MKQEEEIEYLKKCIEVQADSILAHVTLQHKLYNEGNNMIDLNGKLIAMNEKLIKENQSLKHINDSLIKLGDRLQEIIEAK